MARRHNDFLRRNNGQVLGRRMGTSTTGWDPRAADTATTDLEEGIKRLYASGSKVFGMNIYPAMGRPDIIGSMTVKETVGEVYRRMEVPEEEFTSKDSDQWANPNITGRGLRRRTANGY